MLTTRTLMDGSTAVTSLARTYEDVAFLSGLPLKVLDEQTITQDEVTFTIDLDYSASNFHDYLQPTGVTESVSNHSVTRVTTRTFDYGFTSAYILPKVASTTLTIGTESFQTSFSYNHATGFLTSQTALGMTTTFGSDGFGNMASVTDPHNHVTTTSYQWGVPASIVTPEYTISRSVNSNGRVTSETRNGHTTTVSYDDLGRVVQVSPATGNATATSYATDGSAETVTRGSSWVTTTVDGFGRPIATQNVVGVWTTATYDAEGRQTFRSMPFTGESATGNSFTYDALGRVTVITHADDSFATFAYNDTDDHHRRNQPATTQHWQTFAVGVGG
jgi:YD repeat-containing protein